MVDGGGEGCIGGMVFAERDGEAGRRGRRVFRSRGLLCAMRRGCLACGRCKRSTIGGAMYLHDPVNVLLECVVERIGAVYAGISFGARRLQIWTYQDPP